MKTKNYLRLVAVIFAFAAFFLNSAAYGATNLVLWANALNSTNAVLGPNSSNDFWFGFGSTPTIQFDPLVDAGGDTNSGSMRFDVDISTNGAANQSAIGFDFNPGHGFANNIPMAYLSNYNGMAVDILWDTNVSTLDGDGNWGVVDFRTEGTGYSGELDNNLHVLSSTNGWQHFQFAFPNTYSIQSLGLVFIYLANFNATGQQSLHGHAGFWMDNIVMTPRLLPPPPPPTMNISKFSGPQGLLIYAANPTNPGQNQRMRTLQSPYFWFGQGSTPVTYALTVTNFPNASHSNFEADIILATAMGDESAPWFNEANLIQFSIINDSTGEAVGTFRYKTNAPNGFGDFFGGGTLLSITNPSPLGTWTMAFNNDTNISVTTPNGSVATAIMPPDSAALFAGSTFASIGIAAGGSNNIGQSVTFSRFKITGAGGPGGDLDETFLAPLDTITTWGYTADTQGAVIALPSDPAYWLNWTLPDPAFTILATTNITAGTNILYNIAPAALFQNGTNRQALIQTSVLTPGMANYFRLVQTNAP